MKKENQLIENKKCLDALARVSSILEDENTMRIGEERLRTCTASVIEYQRGAETLYLLKSYYTYVAAIIKTPTEECAYDFLRNVYGYTATSAQHITKFFADYATPDCVLYRWYPVDA